MKTQVHDFRKSLAFSHAASDLPIWLEVYKQFFPDMVACVDHRENGYWQHQGIDRSLTLSNSKQVLVDEKVRDVDYGDILLEFISNDKTGTPGWVCKPLMADFIAYAVLPRGKAYLLPVLSLQNAWNRNGREWRNRHRVVTANNAGYKTHSVCVPTKEVFRAITTAQIAEFGPIQ